MIRRYSILFAILLTVTALILAGCGGGGGGGGGGNPTVTGMLTGVVFDAGGLKVSGATVTVADGTRATVSGTTNSAGYYTVADVPLGVSLTISISKSGMPTKTFDGITLNPQGTTSVYLNIVMNGEDPPTGSTISLLLANGDPLPAQIYMGEEKWFKVVVKNGYGDTVYPSDSGWKASLCVTGDASGSISIDDPSLFKVVGTKANGTAKISAFLTRADGTLATTTITMPIQEMETPPPPPL